VVQLSGQPRAEIFPGGGQSRHFAYPFQIVDDATQMAVNKMLYPFCTTKKMPRYGNSHKKSASLAAMAYTTIIHTIGYLQIFKAEKCFSSKHCHGLQRNCKL